MILYLKIFYLPKNKQFLQVRHTIILCYTFYIILFSRIFYCLKKKTVYKSAIRRYRF